MSGPVRLAVFDCDGTLVDGQHEICAAMDEAFGSLGLLPPHHGAVRRAVGLSLPQTMRMLAPEQSGEIQAALVEAYKAAYRHAREAGRVAEPLFAGIRGVLDALRADGWELGVATGKSLRGLTHCLAVNDLADHFITLQTADHHPSKPHPAMLEAALDEAMALPADAVMIGDTTYDIAMAKAAGVRAIGVSWGYHQAIELMAAGADTVAMSPGELLEILA
jgi:phosphoglycolate phosphatase